MVEGSMKRRALGVNASARAARRRITFGAGLSWMYLALAAPLSTRAQAPASAPAHATVLVGMAECSPARYEPDALWKSLQVELAALGVEARRVNATDTTAESAAASALASVAVGCADSADGLTLRVSDAASGKELSRTLAVADVAPAARSRALALAVVALLESSWSEVVATQDNPAEHDALPASVEDAVRKRLVRKLSIPEEPEEPTFTHDRKAPEPPGTLFEVSAAMRAFPGRDTGMLGVQLGLLKHVTAPMRILFEIEGLWGRNDLSDANGKVGVVRLYWLTAGGGLSFHTDSRPDIECGPRLLVGYAIADAKATREGATAKDASGLVVSALLAASVRAELGGLTVLTGADIGYTLVGVAFLGDQSHLAGMADTTFMLRTGVSW
jgi:hypothetical protein